MRPTDDGDMGHHQPKCGSPRVAKAFEQVAPFDHASVGARSNGHRIGRRPQPLGQEEMRHITISEHGGARQRHTIAAAFWVVVGIFAVIVFGDALTLLAFALAIVTAAWWIFREVKHRVKSIDARRYVTSVVSREGHRPWAWATDRAHRPASAVNA
jgi:hypothetical protein